MRCAGRRSHCTLNKRKTNEWAKKQETTSIFCSSFIASSGDTRRTTSELPCWSPVTHFGAKSEAWRHKMLHVSQSDTVLGIANPICWILNTISSEKGCLISMPFRLTCIDVRIVKFSRLLNPDWSIQISGAPVVCKNVMCQVDDYPVCFPGFLVVSGSRLFQLSCHFGRTVQF